MSINFNAATTWGNGGVSLGDVLAMFGGTTPMTEKTGGDAGATQKIADAGHRHDRITSVTTQTLDVNGRVTVTFTRAFPTQPTTFFAYEEAADAGVLVIKRESWIMTGSDYTGCVVRAYRSGALTGLTGIVLLGSLITQLQNYNPFGGGSLLGTPVDVIAIPRTVGGT